VRFFVPLGSDVESVVKPCTRATKGRARGETLRRVLRSRTLDPVQWLPAQCLCRNTPGVQPASRRKNFTK
jgi:hypothetical protein